MSSDNSGLCLPVADFLTQCNWEGYLLQSNNLSYQNQALNTSWKCLSVQQFFGLSNWEGKAEIKQEPVVEIAWQRRSVQEFFRNCNWQGQLLESSNWQYLDKASHFKQQVREFFQFFPWEGNPEIGTLPQQWVAQQVIPIQVDVEPTIADLSELF